MKMINNNKNYNISSIYPCSNSTISSISNNRTLKKNFFLESKMAYNRQNKLVCNPFYFNNSKKVELHDIYIKEKDEIDKIIKRRGNSDEQKSPKEKKNFVSSSIATATMTNDDSSCNLKSSNKIFINLTNESMMLSILEENKGGKEGRNAHREMSFCIESSSSNKINGLNTKELIEITNRRKKSLLLKQKESEQYEINNDIIQCEIVGKEEQGVQTSLIFKEEKEEKEENVINNVSINNNVIDNVNINNNIINNSINDNINSNINNNVNDNDNINENILSEIVNFDSIDIKKGEQEKENLEFKIENNSNSNITDFNKEKDDNILTQSNFSQPDITYSHNENAELEVSKTHLANIESNVNISQHEQHKNNNMTINLSNISEIFKNTQEEIIDKYEEKKIKFFEETLNKIPKKLQEDKVYFNDMYKEIPKKKEYINLEKFISDDTQKKDKILNDVENKVTLPSIRYDDVNNNLNEEKARYNTIINQEPIIKERKPLHLGSPVKNNVIVEQKVNNKKNLKEKSSKRRRQAQSYSELYKIKKTKC